VTKKISWGRLISTLRTLKEKCEKQKKSDQASKGKDTVSPGEERLTKAGRKEEPSIAELRGGSKLIF